MSDETLELVNERTGHVATLGLDAVKTYTSDPGRDAGGVKYGFLSLTLGGRPRRAHAPCSAGVD